MRRSDNETQQLASAFGQPRSAVIPQFAEQSKQQLKLNYSHTPTDASNHVGQHAAGSGGERQSVITLVLRKLQSNASRKRSLFI